MIPTLVEIPLVFTERSLPLHSFGLMMVLAFLCAWRRLSLSLERAGEDPLLAERMVTWAAVGGIVGARIGYIVSYPREFFAQPLATIFSGAGFVFYGGFIGGALAVWVLLRREGKSFLHFADLTAPALAVGYAVGRIGCQLSGDGDYGVASSLPWAMPYPEGVVPTDEHVHPAPVYETLMALLIAVILLWERVQAALPRTGQLFALYLALSAIERFVVETIRIEPVVALSLTQAQLVALALMAAAAWLGTVGARDINPRRVSAG